MLIDYWLAGHLGAAWLRLRKGLRTQSGDLPGLCSSVAHGATVSARTLWRVQDFAITAWLRFSQVVMASFLAIGLAIGIPVKLLSGGALPFAAVVSVTSVTVLASGIAAAQTVTILYRAIRVQLYLRKADRVAAFLPLPPGSPGLPRRSDFWAALVTATAIIVLLLYAGFRNAPH